MQHLQPALQEPRMRLNAANGASKLLNAANDDANQTTANKKRQTKQVKKCKWHTLRSVSIKIMCKNNICIGTQKSENEVEANNSDDDNNGIEDIDDGCTKVSVCKK